MATYREVPRAPERKVGNVKQSIIVAGLFGLILSPGLLSAQAKNNKKGDAKNATAAASAALPAVDPANRPTYRLGPGDVLEVRVYKEPDISGNEILVRTDGRITLPLVKDVPAGGLTIEELEKVLVAKLKPLVRDPDVTVILRQSNSQRAYVMGAVRKEGPVKLIDRMTVLQALAESGGVTEYAKRKKIFILRGADGKQTRIPFDYEAVLSGQKPEMNVVIEPGDTIVVPN
jgi:polysaccharide biosynthesis/export protein